MATGATAIGLQQVQHSQLSEQIQGFKISTTEHCHPAKSVRLTSSCGFAKAPGPRPHYCGKRENLYISRGRMLLLYKPVGDSERKYLPVTKKNQGKKPGNILEYEVEELGPMGSPLGRSTYCVSLTTAPRALCDKPPHQVHSHLDGCC
jgi:hypothetical protein